MGFFVNSLVVSNYTPEGATDVPVIGLYYILNIFLLAIWLGATVGVLNFHFRGHKVTSIPNWLKRVLFMRTNNNTSLDLVVEIDEKNNLKVKDESKRTLNNKQTTNTITAETNIDKILKIMKIYIHKLDKTSSKSKQAEKIAIEWKEAARRIDLIFFVLVTTTVTVLPIYLFGKFMTNEYTIVNRVCSCF